MMRARFGSRLSGRRIARALAVFALAPFAVAAYDEIEVTGGGSIHGRVVFEGEAPELRLSVNADREVCAHHEGEVASPRLQVSDNGGVAHAVVYLKDIERGKSLAELDAPLLLDQEGCLYEPFVQVAPQRSVLTLVNSDPLNHNVHARMEGHRDPFNYAMPNANWPEKQKIQTRLLRPGILSIGCDVHMWMSAYIFVVRHPYYAVTDEEGCFELSGVPPGEYELGLWHAGWGATPLRTAQGQPAGYEYDPPVELSLAVSVAAGAATEANFTLRDGE
jgi:hypothetical protein